MDTVIKIIGIYIVIAATLYLFRPSTIKALIEFFKNGKRLYLAGLIRLAFAVVFLLGARECDKSMVITVLGILFLISGLLLFIIGLEKLKRILEWWLKQSDIMLRFISLIVLALGILIIFSA